MGDVTWDMGVTLDVGDILVCGKYFGVCDILGCGGYNYICGEYLGV